MHWAATSLVTRRGILIAMAYQKHTSRGFGTDIGINYRHVAFVCMLIIWVVLVS